jgi:hypothetical protein
MPRYRQVRSPEECLERYSQSVLPETPEARQKFASITSNTRCPHGSGTNSYIGYTPSLIAFVRMSVNAARKSARAAVVFYSAAACRNCGFMFKLRISRCR